MTLFQTIAMWGLRALVFWAALEFGFDAFDEAQAAMQERAQIAARAQATQRWTRHAHALEIQALQARALLTDRQEEIGGGASPSSDRPGETLSEDFRIALNAMGAADIRIEPSETRLDRSLARVRLTAHWRERPDRLLLSELGARMPNAQLESIAYRAAPGAGSVDVEATIIIIARVPATP